MVTMSIREYAKEIGANKIYMVVRENTNQYPYLTFLRPDSQAENVYFSIRAGEGVTAGTPVTPAFLDKFQIAKVENAAGEQRVKVSLKGESGYLDLDALV